VNVYLNQEAPQIELKQRVCENHVFFVGQSKDHEVGCWKATTLEPVTKGARLPEANLVAYSLPPGLFIVASWTEPDEDPEDARLVYYIIDKTDLRIKVYAVNQAGKDYRATLQAVHAGRFGLTLLFELLV
jgi:hypothetical protein